MSSSSLELKNIWFTICKVMLLKLRKRTNLEISNKSHCLLLKYFNLFYLQSKGVKKILNKSKKSKIHSIYCYKCNVYSLWKRNNTILTLVSKVLKIINPIQLKLIIQKWHMTQPCICFKIVTVWIIEL